jgi:hypothetical protein
MPKRTSLLSPEDTVAACRAVFGAPEASRRRATGQAACWRGSSSVTTAPPLGRRSAPGLLEAPRAAGSSNSISQTGLRPRPPVEPSTPAPGLLTRVEAGPYALRRALGLPSVAPSIEGRSDRGEVSSTTRCEDHAEQAMATPRRGQGAARPGLRSFQRSPPLAAHQARRRAGPERGRGGDRGAFPSKAACPSERQRWDVGAPNTERQAATVLSGSTTPSRVAAGLATSARPRRPAPGPYRPSR